MDETIKRINELAKLAKTRKLTKKEELERTKLREEYIKGFRNNFKSQMENVYIKEKDGSVTKLTD